ncbi:MAG: DUF1016 N-terminal domain-containing protein [Thermoleophilia bacterium]
MGERIQREILGSKRAEYGKQIVASLMRQLSWTHFLELIPIKDDVQRSFYAEICRIERWSSIFAGWTGMSANRTRRRQSASSFAVITITNRSSCFSFTRERFGLPNI